MGTSLQLRQYRAIKIFLDYRETQHEKETQNQAKLVRNLEEHQLEARPPQNPFA